MNEVANRHIEALCDICRPLVVKKEGCSWLAARVRVQTGRRKLPNSRAAARAGIAYALRPAYPAYAPRPPGIRPGSVTPYAQTGGWAA